MKKWQTVNQIISLYFFVARKNMDGYLFFIKDRIFYSEIDSPNPEIIRKIRISPSQLPKGILKIYRFIRMMLKTINKPDPSISYSNNPYRRRGMSESIIAQRRAEMEQRLKEKKAVKRMIAAQLEADKINGRHVFEGETKKETKKEIIQIGNDSKLSPAERDLLNQLQECRKSTYKMWDIFEMTGVTIPILHRFIRYQELPQNPRFRKIIVEQLYHGLKELKPVETSSEINLITHGVLSERVKKIPGARFVSMFENENPIFILHYRSLNEKRTCFVRVEKSLNLILSVWGNLEDKEIFQAFCNEIYELREYHLFDKPVMKLHNKSISHVSDLI